MRKLWILIGRVLFWLAWPVMFIYFKFGKRTRVLIVFEDQVVVNKGWISSGKWSLPGGGLHWREKSEIGAVREVHEETALDVSPAQLQSLGLMRGSQYGLSFKYWGFIVHLDKKLIVSATGIEILECRWMPVGELSIHNATSDLLYLLNTFKEQT